MNKAHDDSYGNRGPFLLSKGVLGMLRRRMEGKFDSEDAARFLGVHRETVRVWVRLGLLKSVDSSRPLVFEKKVVMSFQRPKIGRPPKDQES